jgi:hypothetical protein
MRPAAVHRIADCVADRVWFTVPQPTEWQSIGNEIDTAFIFARSDFVNVQTLAVIAFQLL